MTQAKTVGEWMAEKGVGLRELADAAGLDKRVVDAIAHCRYTPSPDQRQRLATALGVEPDAIAWGHSAQVTHVYGHGPQFGRSP